MDKIPLQMLPLACQLMGELLLHKTIAEQQLGVALQQIVELTPKPATPEQPKTEDAAPAA